MPKETLTLLLAFPHINALSPLLEAFYNSLGVLIVDLCVDQMLCRRNVHNCTEM